MRDKYSAVWVSHSSMSDYIKCPRAYFLNNVYKDPETRRKISIINPHLALGQAVHNTIESLSKERIPSEKRMEVDLIERFENEWKKVSGKKGGFLDEANEQEMKERGYKMIQNVIKNPGPLIKKALNLPEGTMPPNFYLSEEDNIILCGKVDWIEYLPETDSIHIIDFKTGKREENDTSLQLPIYLLLATNLQKRPVMKASYWYLDESIENTLVSKPLPPYEDAFEEVLSQAKKIKDAREIGVFECPYGGCPVCEPYEKIIHGQALRVGINEINQDVYIV